MKNQVDLERQTVQLKKYTPRVATANEKSRLNNVKMSLHVLN